MRSLSKEFFIIGLLVLIGSAFSLATQRMPLPWTFEEASAEGEISIEDAYILRPHWVDARPRDEYEDESAPDAIHLNDDVWEAQLPVLVQSWLIDPRPIVVFCGSESCGLSKRIRNDLVLVLPEAEIYSLIGGWDAFAK